MVKEFQNTDYWTLILGGSSGLGLASAKKLAQHGMNIFVVHRSSRFQDAEIANEFNKIKAAGIKFMSFNMDAMNPEKRHEVISTMQKELGDNGRVRTLV